ncbi:MAG: RluA family pseudouridine synthase [Thermoguttaceae bacterium]
MSDFTQSAEATLLAVTEEQSLWRLDLFLADAFPPYSRTLLRKAITAGGVVIDPDSDHATLGRPSYRLKPGQVVRVTLPELPRESVVPEDIPLDILYEDDDIAVVNKPAGMVVHPSRGHWSGTLVSALAFHFAGKLSTVRGPARPGIVHRLDRDTSGAILVAKHDVAHARLATLFQEKRVQKEYRAIVVGEPSLDRDFVDAAIAHHPHHREKMCIARPGDAEAKTAQTRFEYERRYRGFTVVRAFPLTGRTHQIRVHLLHRGHPVLCDPLYSSRAQITRDEIAETRHAAGDDSQVLLSRHALHAHRITCEHPSTGRDIEIIAPLPADMLSVIDALNEWRT